ncbi:MAG: class I SAM-dependent methyltransferase [Gemmatimonadales bacterium]|nr:class I SAM-dependent methyltransferase [Gemmatimonadales bacterium]
MTRIPHTLAELGPGDSLGIGFSAMLCGVDKYFALDVVEYSNNPRNLEIFDELVDMFRARAPRPTKGWPDFDEFLDTRLFPSHILTDELMESALSPERVASIRRAIQNLGQTVDGISISYVVPWSNPEIIEHSSVDLVISHSVLEHVSDLEATYHALYSWLKPQGRISHQIDFTSHGLSNEWNGYRAYSQWLWKIILGKRTFLINREPYSTHLDLILHSGFQLDIVLKRIQIDGIPRNKLDKSWKAISDEDLNCSGVFLQATKP